MASTYDLIADGLKNQNILDVHTHLIGGHLGARGLHDILLYHMAVSDLYAAGCPSGARLTQYPGVPDKKEAEFRIREALPYLKFVRNTSTSWGVRTILKSLYGIEEQVDESNWERIDAVIRERADDRSWHLDVMNRTNIKRYGAEHARRENGISDDVLQYSLEWGFFTRCQWGEYDTGLYELEKCWGKLPSSPSPIGAGSRPKPEREIKTLSDVKEAVDWYVDHMPFDQIVSMATHISTDIDFTVVGPAEMEKAIKNRATAGPAERDVYASYVNELFLTRLEEHADTCVFQFSFGAEPLPFETSSRIYQKTLAQIAEMASRHPKLRFQCFLSSYHANQTLGTICREVPNMSVSGYWWHNFFPGIIQRVIEERLDMLPVNKQVGFFSDAYCVEWAYAKWMIVRKELTQALTAKVEKGQYTVDLALEIANAILWETPQTLNGMIPIKE